MAWVYDGLFGQNQSKTAQVNITASGSASLDVGDKVFAAWAGDSGAAWSSTSDVGTATIAWTRVSNTPASDLDAWLFQGVCSAAGTLTSVTVVTTISVTARAIIVGLYSDVGTVRAGTGYNTGTGTTAIGCIGNDIAGGWQVDDLVIATVGFEGPDGDTHAVAQAGTTLTDLALVGALGTTGSGASSNITCCLVHGRATAVGGFSERLQATNDNSRDWAGAGCAFPPTTTALGKDPHLQHRRKLQAINRASYI